MALRKLSKAGSRVYLGMGPRHAYAATADRNADWTLGCWPITASGVPDGPASILGEHMRLKDADELVYKHIEANA